MSMEKQKPLVLESIRPLTPAIQDFEIYPLIDKLREKFSSDELDFAFKGREGFVLPENLKDADLHSKLIDRVIDEVFKHLLEVEGKYTYEEILLSTVMFPVWNKNNLTKSPLFFTNLANVIFFTTNYMGEVPKSMSYRDAKNIMYSYLAPQFVDN